MPTVEHSALTTGELHEPKGADTATSGEIYVADGAGSGSWVGRSDTFTVLIHDISSSGDTYIPIPYAGTVTKVQTVLGGAIAGSDVVFTVYNSAAASMGTLTITQSGSAAGDVDTLAPSSNNTLTASDWIKVNCDGGATSHVDTVLVICVDGS
jgi:hypothetical protein